MPLYFDRKNYFWKDWIYEGSILLGTGIFLDLATTVSFHFQIRNVPMKSFGDFGTGKFLHERRSREWRNFEILYESRKAHPNSCASHIFPHEWLSRRGEKKIHHVRRSREWWIFFLPQLLSHEWGKIVTRMGIAMYLEWWIGNFSRSKFQKWLDPHSY